MSRARIIQIALAIGIASYCSANVYYAYQGYVHRADKLYWDPATHAFYGVKLTLALQSLNPLKVLAVTNEQVLWPPLHSYLQVPFMLALGKNFFASSVCSFFFLVMCFIALAYCYQQISSDWFGLVFLLCLAGTCPFYLAYGSMPMLEIFGATLTIWSAALYMRHSRWFPLSLALLFFLKYNYCIYLLLPLAVTELVPRIISFRKKAPAKLISLITPFRLIVATFAFLLFVILVTGGFSIKGLSVRGIGNPLYILYLIVLIRAAFKRQYAKAWNRIRGTGWEWFVIPVLIWLLIPIPNRIKTLVSFTINAPLGGHSPNEFSYYTYYLQILPEYFASQIIMGICLMMALAGVWKYRHNKNSIFLSLLFFLPLILMTLNQNKQERYLFTFIFTVWILASLTIAGISNVSVRAIYAASLCLLMIYPNNVQKVKQLVSWPFIPAYIDPAVEFIAGEVSEDKVVRILGVSNEMSPALLSYHIQKRNHFRTDQNIDWRLEKDPPQDSHLIVIQHPDNKVVIPSLQPIRLVNYRAFANGLVIQHFVLKK